MGHIIRLPKPHSRKQEIIMRSLLTPGLTEMWVPCGTKFGKSIACSASIAARAATSNDLLFRWVAPIYTQTKIGYNYTRKFLPPPPETAHNNHDLSLVLNGCNSRIEFKSGKFPEDLEGEAVNGYILDECAKMVQQVYDSAKTTTTVTRGPIVGISTPRGKNWFYSKCMSAKEEMEWALAKGIPPKKIYITAPSSDNPAVTQEAIEDARKNMPDRLFRQYYLAEFIEDGAVFNGYNDCFYGDELFQRGDKQFWLHEDASNAQVVIGVDWAKTKDWTVFIAFDLNTRRMVGFERFHRTPYTEAIRKLMIFCKKFHDIVVVRHDKTGLGNVIDDQLAYTNLPYEGVTFTNQVKAEMVTQLITCIEQKMVLFPRWQHLKDELDAYEVQVTASGNMTYGAIIGKHDDIVSATMLANTALIQYGDDGSVVNSLDDIVKPVAFSQEGNDQSKDKRNPVEEFYRDLLEDED